MAAAALLPGTTLACPGDCPKNWVHHTLGEPKQKETDLEGTTVTETWLYESDDMKTTLVILQDGVVTTVKTF